MKFSLKTKSLILVLGMILLVGFSLRGRVPISKSIPNLTDTNLSQQFMEQQTIIPGHFDTSARQPAIDKTSIVIMPAIQIPQMDESVAWAWTPTLRFNVNGPMENNTYAFVSFTFPDGKFWFEEECGGVGDVWAGFPAKFKCPQHNPDKKAKMTDQTGVFSFKILLRNTISGKKIELFSGKVKMDKFADNPTNNPNHFNHYVYYPRLDWKLPMAVIYTTQPTEDAETNGPLKISCWFRGNAETVLQDSKLKGQLFYQGNQVAEANEAKTEYSEATENRKPFDYDSAAKVFTFNARLFETNKNSGDSRFPIYKNAGDYEVKILQNGKLARVIKFTVDSAGNVVNNGINRNNKLGTTRILVPAQIIGDQDTKLDKNVWQTEGYWGSPLVGFTAP